MVIFGSCNIRILADEVTHLQHHVPKTLYLGRHAQWSYHSQLMEPTAMIASLSFDDAKLSL